MLTQPFHFFFVNMLLLKFCDVDFYLSHSGVIVLDYMKMTRFRYGWCLFHV